MKTGEKILVMYDIHDDRRRTQTAKLLSGYGYRIQESVFICSLGERVLAKMTEQIGRKISEDDDVRIVRMEDGKMSGFYRDALYPVDEMIIV